MRIFKAGTLRGAEMRRLRRELALTRWGIWAESAARAFWPVFVILCLALALALLGAFAAFGPTGHRVLLGLFALALVAALVLGGARFRRPDEAAIRARLDSSDPRRPLATLEDELAIGRGAGPTESVWRAHRQRAAAAAARLRAGWPDLRLSSRDRWALRLFAPALLIAGLIATGGDWTARIATIADPAPLGDAPAAGRPAAMAEAWATPPAYTGLGTIYLQREQGAADPGAAPVQVPQGSQLTIRVTDAGATPTLDGGALAGMAGFQTLGGGLAEATGVLSSSGQLVVGGPDGELARWAIEMIPDAPPEIALQGEPRATLTRALELAFRAEDDYGVVAAWAEMAPEGHDPEASRGLPLPVISFGLPLPITGHAAEVEETAIRDFTAHPWAGAEVMLRLYAEDGAGQVTATEPLSITLPDRRFSHPMARALVEQRRELALDYAEAGRVLDVLQAVTRRPDEVFEDPGVFLTVRSAIRRLAYGVGTETVRDEAPPVVELLWQAALALEDGDLSAALERLRTAQEQLREALENGTDEDVSRAMEELRAAIDEYLQQLAQQQQQNPNGQQQPMDPNQMLSQQDLQEMLDQMQQQAESGLRDQARDMLSELQQMLENLQAAQGQQQMGQGQQAMQELQDMIQRQRDLSDRTFDELRQRRREQQMGEGQQGQQGQQGQMPGQQPGWGEGQGRGDEHGRQGQGQGGETGEGDRPGQSPGRGGLAGEQEALRRQLDEMARGLGNGGEAAARALEEAARSMGEARDDLQQGANSDAVRDQMDALDRLNEGAEALAQEMQQGQGEGQAEGEREGRGQGRDQSRNDPFDRPTSSYGALDGRSTKVPDQALIDRARELMRELRRRAAEPARPTLELEYFERLLERF